MENQHNVWLHETRLLWQRTSLRRGMTVLDVGSGPGFVSLELAEVVGPTGRVIALDESRGSLAKLRVAAKKRGLGHIETHVCDLNEPNAIEKLGIAPASVDLAFGRWIFMYLQTEVIVSVVKALVGLLRPNAFLAVHEFGSYLSVKMQVQDRALRPVVEAFHASITTPDAGLHLPSIVSRCGLRVWDEHEIVKIIRPRTPSWIWPDQFFKMHGPLLLNENPARLSKQEWSQFERVWKTMRTDPKATFVAWPIRQLIARKPRGSQAHG